MLSGKTTSRAELLALPTDRLEIRERYSLTPVDFDLINRHRTGANRLGFAIQLCLLRYPGRAWLSRARRDQANCVVGLGGADLKQLRPALKNAC
jgi:TnpA family transposase